jgi:hypothetical protein
MIIRRKKVFQPTQANTKTLHSYVEQLPENDRQGE